MIRSMTAFARTTRQFDDGQCTWEIKSLNSRYLELHFRLPEEFKALENDLRALAKAQLNRGKIEIGLRYQANDANTSLKVNQPLVEALSHAVDQVQEVTGPGNALDALKILQWPGVLVAETPDTKVQNDEVLSVFNDALAQLNHAREREGAALDALIRERCDECQALSEQADNIMPEAIAAHREHLLKKLHDLLENPDTERLEQEMILLAQKADIAEETDRLRTHLNEVLSILERDEPVGRRLDFMMQELNREANTLSSKAMRTDLTRVAVDLKVLIEQMREQVQNIE